MKHKYSKAAQGEWLNTESSWETKRREEFLPTVGFSSLTIALCGFGFYLLNSMADWMVGL